MKTTALCSALLAALALLGSYAQAESFSYHGNLEAEGRPANGSFDLKLSLYSKERGGSALSGDLTLNNVLVKDGRFSTEVNFGPLLQIDGPAWLQVAVKTSGGGSFENLSDRAMVNVEGGCPGGWTLDGNSGNPIGSYLGTADNQAVDLRANNRRILRLEPKPGPFNGDAPNILGGSSINSVGAAFGATVAGGGTPLAPNAATADFSTVTGGTGNTASGVGSTVAGGVTNTAAADYSFAAGNRAVVGAAHNGTFVWADNQGIDFSSSAPNQFLIRASGGVALNTSTIGVNEDLVVSARNAPGDADADLAWRSRDGGVGTIYLRDSDSGLVTTGFASYNFNTVPSAGRFINTTTGAHLTSGGAWTNSSSRALKEAFASVDPVAILDKVMTLSLSTWRYKNSEEGAHLGPMAEDFSAAFGLGGDAQHIATVDADGVALAAIQGLNQRLEEKSAALEQRNAELESQLDAVMSRLTALEAMRKE